MKIFLCSKFKLICVLLTILSLLHQIFASLSTISDVAYQLPSYSNVASKGNTTHGYSVNIANTAPHLHDMHFNQEVIKNKINIGKKEEPPGLDNYFNVAYSLIRSGEQSYVAIGHDNTNYKHSIDEQKITYELEFGDHNSRYFPKTECAFYYNNHNLEPISMDKIRPGFTHDSTIPGKTAIVNVTLNQKISTGSHVFVCFFSGPVKGTSIVKITAITETLSSTKEYQMNFDKVALKSTPFSKKMIVPIWMTKDETHSIEHFSFFRLQSEIVKGFSIQTTSAFLENRAGSDQPHSACTITRESYVKAQDNSQDKIITHKYSVNADITYHTESNKILKMNPQITFHPLDITGASWSANVNDDLIIHCPTMHLYRIRSGAEAIYRALPLTIYVQSPPNPLDQPDDNDKRYSNLENVFPELFHRQNVHRKDDDSETVVEKLDIFKCSSNTACSMSDPNGGAGPKNNSNSGINMNTVIFVGMLCSILVGFGIYVLVTHLREKKKTQYKKKKTKTVRFLDSEISDDILLNAEVTHYVRLQEVPDQYH